MCSSIIDGLGVKRQLGAIVGLSNRSLGIWQGFARSENIKQWYDGGWEWTVLPHIYEFVEGKDKIVFPIAAGHKMTAIWHPKKYIGAHHPVNIITRASVGSELAIHSRMPLLVKL